MNTSQIYYEPVSHKTNDSLRLLKKLERNSSSDTTK